MIDKLKTRIKNKIRKVIGYDELIDIVKGLINSSFGGGGGDNSFWKEFSGFTSEDIPLLQKYIYKEALSSKDGYITDFLGIRHKVDFFPKNYIKLSGAVFQRLPIPDDGFHAETIEYVACLNSVENAGSSYTMFELGAGWGPWMSIAGTAAKRKGIKTINLIGVEGEHNKMTFIKKHLTENELRPDTEDMKTCFNNVNTVIYDGVINTTGNDVEFQDSLPNAWPDSMPDNFINVTVKDGGQFWINKQLNI